MFFLQEKFTVTPCGTAGVAGTTRWPEIALLCPARRTSLDSTRDVSINAQRVHALHIEYILLLHSVHMRIAKLSSKCKVITPVHSHKPDTATAAALCVTGRIGVEPRPRSKPAPAHLDLQPYSYTLPNSIPIVMVSTLVIHAFTWDTTHLPTLKGWKAECV